MLVGYGKTTFDCGAQRRERTYRILGADVTIARPPGVNCPDHGLRCPTP